MVANADFQGIFLIFLKEPRELLGGGGWVEFPSFTRRQTSVHRSLPFGTIVARMSREGSWLVHGLFHLLANGVYEGYNPLIPTFDPNFQRDILVEEDRRTPIPS